MEEERSSSSSSSVLQQSVSNLSLSSLSSLTAAGGVGAASTNTNNAASGSSGYIGTENEQLLQFWRQLDLSSQRVQWDKTCNEMREMKTASIAGRKRLNELTKTFRSKTKEEQIVIVFELLKAYQEEIDQLSRRCKLSETAFFAVYKQLYDAPDPAESIAHLIHQLSSNSMHNLEIERLQNEITQYDVEFQRLKNQDITIRRLEDKIHEYQVENESKIQEEVDKRLNEMRNQCNQQVQEAKDMQKSVEKRLAMALESAKLAQQSADRAQNQLFEVHAQTESKVTTLQQENTFLAEETSRLQLSLHEANSEMETLRKTLAAWTTSASDDQNASSSSGTDASHSTHQRMSSSTTNSPTKGKSHVYFTEDQKETYELVISQLREELRKVQDLTHVDKLKADQQVKDLQQSLAKEREHLLKLQHDLQQRPTREDFLAMKKRLRTVQKIAFHVEDDDDHEDKGNHEDEDLAPESTMADQMQLETMLSNKIKSLESELTSTRKEHMMMKASSQQEHDALQQMKIALENSTQIIKRLEHDLETRNNAIENLMNELTTLKHAASQHAKHGGHNDDLADLLGVHSSSSSASSQAMLSAAAAVTSSTMSNQQMVSILQSQRDRYKDKCTTVEANVLKLQEQVDNLQHHIKTLESDNLMLYSKIKFLQMYQTKKLQSHDAYTDYSNTSSSTNVNRRYNSAEEGRYNDDDIEEKYRHLYEQKMNPFAEFSQHEKQRKLRELSVADRIVLNTTMAIVSNHTGRNILLVYLGAMHLLVFFTIYYSAHNVHHGCDPALDHLHSAPH